MRLVNRKRLAACEELDRIGLLFSKPEIAWCWRWMGRWMSPTYDVDAGHLKYAHSRTGLPLAARRLQRLVEGTCCYVGEMFLVSQ